jgi:hypothetical protein
MLLCLEEASFLQRILLLLGVDELSGKYTLIACVGAALLIAASLLAEPVGVYF